MQPDPLPEFPLRYVFFHAFFFDWSSVSRFPSLTDIFSTDFSFDRNYTPRLFSLIEIFSMLSFPTSFVYIKTITFNQYLMTLCLHERNVKDFLISEFENGVFGIRSSARIISEKWYFGTCSGNSDQSSNLCSPECFQSRQKHRFDLFQRGLSKFQ